MSDVAFEDSIDIVRKAFETAGLEIVDLQERRYPDEQIFLVSLEPQHLERAGVVAAGLDAQFAAVGAQVLTTVRPRGAHDPGSLHPHAGRREGSSRDSASTAHQLSGTDF